MKKNFFATIVLALVMALAIVAVPVFATSANPFAVINNGEVAAPVVDTPVATTPETPAVEDIGEAPAVKAPVGDGHVCSITKANEHRHIIDCECGEYQYVHHDELEAEAYNEFFHIYACECGYAYSENHHFLYSEYPEGHAQTCVDCGYQKEMVPHTLVDEYNGYYHKIVCLDCRYVVEKHVGTEFQQHDENVCIASCRECGTSCSVAHDFYSFSCENCEYEMPVYVYGIVVDIFENGNNQTVCFMINGDYIYVDMNNINFNEGDFVKIEHYGDEIQNVTVMVSAGIIDAPTAFPYYIHSDVIWESNEKDFNNIIIDEINFEDDFIYIDFESGNRCIGLTYDYVVYDLMNAEMGELLEGYAYLSFSDTNGRMYFICIW